MSTAVIIPAAAVTCWQLLRAAVAAYPADQQLAERLLDRAIAQVLDRVEP